MLLPPKLIHSMPLASLEELRFDWSPIQVGLCRSPWHVTVSSIMLQRCRRIPYVHQELFTRYPNPLMLTLADEGELQKILQPLGFYRTRARYLMQLSHKWELFNSWTDLRELPGVGDYVADAVSVFCFDCVDLVSNDSVLKEYVCSRRTQ